MTGADDTGLQGLTAAMALAALVVSIVALVPAFTGLWQARAANKVAAGANDLAGQANEIALNAEKLSHRTEARATEPYDVEWTVGWADEHHFFIANQGLDPAHDVRFRIGGPWGAARYSGPAVLAPLKDFTVPCDTTLSQDRLDGEVVMLRIVWRSPAGTPYRTSIQIAGRDVFHHRRAVG